MLVTVWGHTQQDIRLFPGDSVRMDTSRSKIKSFDLNFTAKEGVVNVYKDSRFDKLTEFVGTPVKGATVQMKGYRVQAFFSTDKDEVNGKRGEYLGQYNEHPAYVDYLAPNFRLRLGDFRTRLQAQQWQDQIKLLFPDAIIVEDYIELPGLKKPE